MTHDPAKEVVIDYTNWRGERGPRRIVPTGRMWFGSNEWHTEPQWLMEAIDVEKGAVRTFAVNDIHSWTPVAAGEPGEPDASRP